MFLPSFKKIVLQDLCNNASLATKSLIPRSLCAFHLVEIFHFVEIQSPFCLYLQNGLEYFKFNFPVLIQVTIEKFWDPYT